MTQEEMVGWHHRLDGHEFEQAPGIGDGQGSLARCSPWGRKESDTTEQLNNNFCFTEKETEAQSSEETCYCHMSKLRRLTSAALG